jgi:virginiamycin B lyase
MNISRFILPALVLVFSTTIFAQYSGIGAVTEFPVNYPNLPTAHGHHAGMGSTHEITFNEKTPDAIWITGQTYGYVVRVPLDGKPMKYLAIKDKNGKVLDKSGPHGIEFDVQGRLWVTLEFAGKIVQIDQDTGKILQEYDVDIACSACSQPIGSHPHGMGFAPDGKTIWFTGKATGTVGRIDPNGKVTTFPLHTQTSPASTVGSVPIYIKAGPDGNMWVTELVGNAIARVTPAGVVTEFPIPTHASRPIALVPDPNGRGMWFTEEAGNNIGFIDKDGNITEFPVPKSQNNVILAGLAFDGEKNLWVQQYVDYFSPYPAGADHIVKIDKSILTAKAMDISRVPFTFYEVPSRSTVFHRIIQGPDGSMWFTEMNANKVGKLITGLGRP